MERMRTHFLSVQGSSCERPQPKMPWLSDDGKVVEMQESQNEIRLAQYGEHFPFSSLLLCGWLDATFVDVLVRFQLAFRYLFDICRRRRSRRSSAAWSKMNTCSLKKKSKFYCHLLLEILNERGTAPKPKALKDVPLGYPSFHALCSILSWFLESWANVFLNMFVLSCSHIKLISELEALLILDETLQFHVHNMAIRMQSKYELS